ncbi:hypothetical protein [Paraburkholderia tagetis]|uniref:Uncharacterized protein n=1 Tax=Paraburkholderia tagetis TaxID=2913261 RepID=A0A9X1RUY0_9BURK|nr:hypothetical protein [Paraburkholderia tagetis]
MRFDGRSGSSSLCLRNQLGSSHLEEKRMTDIAVIDPDKDALYERIRLLLFSADLPVQRLEADIDDIGRFTAPDVRSPHLRLVEAMPPLTPAAEAIVRAMIRAYGVELFGRGSANAGLRALIKAGPVKFGQTALMLGPDAPVPERARPLVEAFNRIFERYPESGFAQARCLLSAIGLPVGRDVPRQPSRSLQRD